MTNNDERYCEHCNRETTFYQESDLLWYCDECGNVYESTTILNKSKEELEEEKEDFEYLYGPSIRCPSCHNLVATNDLDDDRLCPTCFEILEINNDTDDD